MKQDGRDSSLTTSLGLDPKRLKAKASRLSLKNQYAFIYRNMYTNESGDIVKAFDSIKHRIHQSNRMLIKNAEKTLLGRSSSGTNSSRDIFSQANISAIVSSER